MATTLEARALTLKQFTERKKGIVRYNSFAFYFRKKGFIAGVYRKAPHFKKFQEENPGIERMLTEEITGLNIPENGGSKEALKPFEELLYAAYLKMRKYVDSDEVLFQ